MSVSMSVSCASKKLHIEWTDDMTSLLLKIIHEKNAHVALSNIEKSAAWDAVHKKFWRQSQVEHLVEDHYTDSLRKPKTKFERVKKDYQTASSMRSNLSDKEGEPGQVANHCYYMSGPDMYKKS